MDISKIQPLEDLSIRQKDCLIVVAEFLKIHKKYPTQREIAKIMGLKSNTAYHYTQPGRAYITILSND
jgi:hypothetical protein